MSHKHYINVVVLTILSVWTWGSRAEAKSWAGITPLHTTRQEVEKLLNVASSGKEHDFFKLPNVNVIIDYSYERCNDTRHQGWDVPPGTVISLTVYFLAKTSLSSLELNLSDFQKKLTDVVGIIVYRNENLGWEIEVKDFEIVTRHTYFATREDNNRFLCHKKK